MTRFGEQKILVPAFRCILADLLFAIDVALGRIDHVQTGIEGAVDQPLDSILWHAAIAVLGATVAGHGYVHPGFTENALFHLVLFSSQRIHKEPGNGPLPEYLPLYTTNRSS